MAGIKDLAKASGLKPEQVKAVMVGVETLVSSGQKVAISGFGTFSKKLRAARVGRNPKTGEPVEILEREALVFKEAR